MGMRILGLLGAVPIEGGLVLMQDGKLIGAIGVSGMASDQDGVVAKAVSLGTNSSGSQSPRHTATWRRAISSMRWTT